MNKILQGVLVLDTDTSRELKKGGKITLEVDNNKVVAWLDENGDTQFTSELLTKDVKVEMWDDNAIYLKPAQYEALIAGEMVTISKGVIVYDEATSSFKLRAKNSTPIHFVVHR